jgi:hypothetical protein
MEVSKDKAFPANRIRSAFSAPWGTSEKLTASFRVRFSNFGGWNMIGITDNPRMAAWWWIGPEGGLREGNFSMAHPKPAMTTLQANTWYQVKITIDVKKDEASFSIGGFKKKATLSSTWGTIAVPIECVRLISAVNIDQSTFIDSISIKDDVD